MVQERRRASQEAQDLPRDPQDGPKTGHEGSKTAEEAPSTAPDHPRTAPDHSLTVRLRWEAQNSDANVQEHTPYMRSNRTTPELGRAGEHLSDMLLAEPFSPS
eukprot:2974676-Pyramimonas_sp.AAC.1